MKRLSAAAAVAALLTPLSAFAACPTYTTIADVGNVPLQTGTLVTVPPEPAGENPGGLNNVLIKIGLTTAIKEGTGHTLFFKVRFSTDNGATWQDDASINWVSYGQQVTVTVPPHSGCVITDPDPTLNVPIKSGTVDHTGAIFDLQYMTNDITSAHPVFSAN